MRVTQSQNVPLSCLSRPLADRLAEAAYRDILGLSYARAFSAAWSTARLCNLQGLNIVKHGTCVVLLKEFIAQVIIL